MRQSLVCVALLTLAALLRLSWLDAGWFGVDQSRDLAWATEIVRGESLPLVGPAMRNRVHLGATYYYFWALPLLVFPGPIAPYVFAGLLGVLATGLTFELGRRVGGVRAGLLAALIFATWPQAVIDGRIAWAPAALPVVCGGLILALVLFVRTGSSRAAVVSVLLAALAVQLHLASLPVALVAAAVLLAGAGALGVGTSIALFALALVVMSPALWALLGAPPPTAGAITPGGGALPSADRAVDLLLLAGEGLTGLMPSQRPLLVRGWLAIELFWGAVVLLSFAYAARLAWKGDRSLGVVALAGLSSLAAVLLVPGESWYYYADAALVPASVVVAVAVGGRMGRPGAAWLVLLAVGRTLLLAWWIHDAAQSGFVSANLDLLRMGGGPALDPTARSRVLGLATRQSAADEVAARFGPAVSDARRRLHGYGFSDLDNDNGFFLGRAMAAMEEVGGGRGGVGSAADSGDTRLGDGVSAGRDRRAEGTPTSREEGVVFYRGEVPASWWSQMGAPIETGPLLIVPYVPWLDRPAARLIGCGGGPPPARPATDPLRYGSGEPSRTRWPCPDPVIEFPLRPGSDANASTIRIFARLEGEGRVVDIDVVPPGAARVVDIDVVPPGAARVIEHPALGRGVSIPRPDAVVPIRVTLALDGPADLDVVELRGAFPPAD